MNSEIITLSAADLNIKILVPRDQVEPGDRISCWWGVTTSAIALCGFLLQDRSIAGCNALELGSGLGLAGVAAGLAGAFVTFSDYIPQALDFCRMNCRLNGLGPDKARFITLDWESPENLGKYDMIFGAEILYDYFFHSSLIRIVMGALKPGGRLIFADRKRLVVSRFLGELTRNGLTCDSTDKIIDVPGFAVQEVSVFKCSKPGSETP